MSAPAVLREQVLEAVKQLPPEALPEVAQFIEFMQFKAMGVPLERKTPEAAGKQREALIRATQGMFADVPTSSEEFARRKQDEIDLEDRAQ